MGTVSEDTETILLAFICNGIAAYESVDPQVIDYELSKSQSDLTEEQYDKWMQTIEKELDPAARLSQLKRQ